MKARYKITIEKIETERRKTEEYRLIGQEPTTKDDAERSYAPDKMPAMKDKYGHIEVESDHTRETEIYKQEVENLDLAAVIVAINGLAK